jgi:hypothetical protein
MAAQDCGCLNSMRTGEYTCRDTSMGRQRVEQNPELFQFRNNSNRLQLMRPGEQRTIEKVVHEIPQSCMVISGQVSYSPCRTGK